MFSTPLITVVMSTYNNEKTLTQSINSVLCQSLKNFIFLIIDDASTDNTKNILNSYDDPRIKLIYNTQNQGLASSLNHGINATSTPFIARMDADDISLPNRLEEQYNFILKNSHIDVCGTAIQWFGELKGNKKFPLLHNDIAANALFCCPMAHPTIFMKRSSFLKSGGYNENFTRAQDYELWCRMIFDYKFYFANIDSILLKYRAFNKPCFLEWHIKILKKNLYRLKINVSKYLISLYLNISLDTIKSHKKYFSYKDYIDLLNSFYVNSYYIDMLNKNSLRKTLIFRANSIFKEYHVSLADINKFYKNIEIYNSKKEIIKYILKNLLYNTIEI